MADLISTEDTHEYVAYTHLLIIYKNGHRDSLEKFKDIIPCESYDEAYKYIKNFEPSLSADGHSATIFKRQDTFIPRLTSATPPVHTEKAYEEDHSNSETVTIRNRFIKNPDPRALNYFSGRSPTHIPVFIDDDTFSHKNLFIPCLKNCTRNHFYIKTNMGEYFFMPSDYKKESYECYLTSLKNIYKTLQSIPEKCIVEKDALSCVLVTDYIDAIRAQFLSFDNEPAREEYYGCPVLTEDDLYLLILR